MEKERIHNLDYLRGLAASGIMFFHYLSYTLGEFHAENFFGRVGIYGVSIFYILSGLTLYKVYYSENTSQPFNTRVFFVKRILRIYPLMTIISLMSIWLFKGFDCTLYEFIINITGLFGFIDWDKGVATGIWSIGNELVFYAFFPLLLLAAKRKGLWLHLMLLISLVLYWYFAFVAIDLGDSASPMIRRHYMNPFNQIFLFAAGFGLGHFFKAKLSMLQASILVVIGTVSFYAYPVAGNRYLLITDWSRFVLTFSCILITIAFYSYQGGLPKLIASILKWTGTISYSIYLLHPLVHHIVGLIRDNPALGIPHFPEMIRLPLSVALTLALSHVSYYYFEMPISQWGKSKLG